MRELKRRLLPKITKDAPRRTPPGVRELKLNQSLSNIVKFGRTPPGVRELKPLLGSLLSLELAVAPLPGCVN